jgi:hypothetical protein
VASQQVAQQAAQVAQQQQLYQQQLQQYQQQLMQQQYMQQQRQPLPDDVSIKREQCSPQQSPTMEPSAKRQKSMQEKEEARCDSIKYWQWRFYRQLCARWSTQLAIESPMPNDVINYHI